MKKGCVILLVLVLLISFVSAGWFSDSWGKITGNVVEENVTEEEAVPEEPIEEVVEEPELSPEEEIPPECIEAGITDLIECSRYVYEMAGGSPIPEGEELMEKCREMGITTQEDCDKLMAGEILPPECVEAGATTAEECSRYYYDKAGAYVPPQPEREGVEALPEQPRPAPELAPTVCAASIKVTFDKELYYIGDTAEIVIGVFDLQGNPIPNYVFYNQIYDTMWHTPGSDKTDNEGYFRVQPTVEKDQKTLGEIKFKVYTAEYSNCNSVEDIAEIEVREKEKPEPVPCGIGTCIPEEEEEEPVDIPDEKVFYSCTGCELEGKCYPIGYRKEGRYCLDNNEFIDQSKAGTCDNNFECKSNVCISGECVGEGLVKKILKWFKKIFGGEPEPEEPWIEMCSELLIEKNIGDYEYTESAYGHKDHQVALYSEDGEQIDIVKCCVAGYGEVEGGAGVVCPFENREDVENALYWLLNKEEITLEEYKGQKVYGAGNAIIWAHEDFIVASGSDPKNPAPLLEEIINAYLDKYPNDLGV